MSEQSSSGTDSGEKVTASLHVKNDEGVTQVVERAFVSSEEAFDEGQTLLESAEEDSRINEGEYCYVQIGRYVADENKKSSVTNVVMGY